MNTRSIIKFLIVAFVLVVGITLLMHSSSPESYQNTTGISDDNNSSTSGTTSTGINSGSTSPSYTLAQVQTHSGSSSCWTIVGTNVYNLTQWINSHPGGPEAILSICGKNGTAAFEAQHGGQRRPADELKNFLIGTYKQ